MKRRRVAPGGWALLIAGILFVVSRVVIEIMRIGNAAAEDRPFAITLLWSTVLALVGTVVFVLLLFCLTSLPSVQRSRFLESTRPGLLRFEAGKEVSVIPTLRALGAPSELSTGRVLRFYFTAVIADHGLEFWAGGSEPRCVWEVPWSAVASVRRGQVARSWKLLESLDVTVRLPEHPEQTVQLSMARARLPLPLSLDEEQIEAILSASVAAVDRHAGAAEIK